MSLNLEIKTTYHQFDSYGMLLVKDDPDSWKDSIGRTVLAWIAYGKPKELYESLEQCLYLWKYTEKTYRYELVRHPKHYREKSSRDHWSYFIIYRVLSDGITFKWIPRMRGMNSWMKSLTGNKLAERLYYMLYIPLARLGNVWLRICRWVGRINEEYSNNWWIKKIPPKHIETIGEDRLSKRTKWQKLWAWIIFKTIPCYPLHNRGWQLYVMRKTPKRDTLCKILLRRVGKSNLMLRLLFGDTTVTQEEINNYPHMTNFRPGVYLDETCRRDIRELTPEEAAWNAYEKDLLVWLFNKQKS